MKRLRFYLVCALMPLWAAALSPLFMINPLNWALILATTGLLHWSAPIAIAFVVVVVSLGIGRIVTNWEAARLSASREGLAKANAAAGMVPTVGTTLVFLVSMLLLPSFNAVGRWFFAAGIGFWGGTVCFIVAFAVAALRTKSAERSSATPSSVQPAAVVSPSATPRGVPSSASILSELSQGQGESVNSPREVTWNDLFLAREELPGGGRWVDIAGPLEVDACWAGATTFGKFFTRHGLDPNDVGYTLVQEVSSGVDAPGFFVERRKIIHDSVSEVDQLRQTHRDDPESRFWICREFDLAVVGDDSVAGLTQELKHTTTNEVLGDLAATLQVVDVPLTICTINAIAWIRISYLVIKVTLGLSESKSLDQNLLAEHRTFAVNQAQEIAARAAQRIVALQPPPL